MKNKKVIIASIISVIVVVLIIIGVVFFAGGKGKEVQEKVEKKQVAEGKLEYSYLTGEAIASEDIMKRPIAIMTENTKQALPQYGIGNAGVIVEAPVEGSYTRLMTITEDYKGLEKMGNVRSCRPYYVYIADEFDAIYAHFGGSVQGLDLIATGIVDNLSGLDGSVEKVMYYRTNDRKAPHNAYTSEEGILKGIETKGYRNTYEEGFKGHYQFATDKTNELTTGTDVAVIKPYYFYNKPYFVYDSKDQLYYRYQFGDKQVDGITNKQLAVTNIIFQDVTDSIYAGTEYLNIEMFGSGTGKFFTNGKMIDITWKKESVEDITHYYDLNGEEIVLNPGKTWLCITEKQYAEKSKYFTTEEEFMQQ